MLTFGGCCYSEKDKEIYLDLFSALSNTISNLLCIKFRQVSIGHLDVVVLKETKKVLIYGARGKSSEVVEDLKIKLQQFVNENKELFDNL